ncbi:MAG: hypothetical protein C3F13_13185 [Anaerolineales bacterium]|nr:hypothetical protein [Anaerolineae bacterium]PWB51392.1 MAG: hypothetical protein C3F13_13185 [Anaerolineales bacterium]
MIHKIIFSVFFLGTLAACAKSSTLGDITPTSIKTTPITNRVAPTKETIIVPSIPESILASPTPKSHLEMADLSNFLTAWNSADVEIIRSLYTQDARYYPESEMQNLYHQQAIDVLVSDPSFAEKVVAHDGMTLRIVSSPMMIYSKLVAFLYRWENDFEGYDGAALLRYEDNKIFLHCYIEASQLTPNPIDDTNYVDYINLDNLMKIWADADQNAAQEIYSKNIIFLSDEDLAQASWRDFSVPPSTKQLLTQFSGWNPTIIGTPQRVGDLVILAWHWEAFDYPKGYGVRLLQYKDAQISADIRYAIRPWEADGKPFMSP